MTSSEEKLKAVGTGVRDVSGKGYGLSTVALRVAIDEAYSRANNAAVAGDYPKAEAGYREVLALDPDYGAAQNNLGNVMMALRRFGEAVDCYRQTLAAGLSHPLVYYNLGTALRRAGTGGAAGAVFRQALALNPAYTEAWNNLANLYREQGDCAAAAAAYLRALDLVPGWDDAHDNLSGALYLLYDSGNRAGASHYARQWMQRHSGHPIARHLGAAILGEGGDSRAGDDYVRQVFDSFAGDFDEKLLSLGYQAPALLVEALAVLGIAEGVDVLDAGCGTGLCGPLLRSWARSLDGIDLSPEMLARAGLRGVYDRLDEGELTAVLTDRPASYDVIVAADVLCYFGALAEVLAAMATALRPGGHLAFSVEVLADMPDADPDPDPDPGTVPYRLLPHGRYAHREAAIRHQLEGAGLRLIAAERAVLRHESGEPVYGLIVLAAM